MAESTVKSMDEIVALCRRRGFIWQSSEPYGGINGFWDYGPLGALLKKNLKDAWWNDVIISPPDGPDGHAVQMVPVDTTIIMHPKVWEASGHVAGFNDPMVDDKETKDRYRADHVYGLYVRFQNQELSTEQQLSELVDWAHDATREIAYGPNLTCIASAPAEAMGYFRSLEKKLRVQINPLDIAGFDAAFEFRKHDGTTYPGVVLQVPDAILRNHIGAVPSPANRDLDWLIKQVHAGKIPLEALQNPAVQSLTEPRMFNLMFETYTGAVRDDDSKTYLRPETAQGIFTQFWNVVDTSRVKVPFGIAQMGKSFRNEVTPRNFTFRSREFEQMEIEFFIHPSEADQWYAYWRDNRYAWWQSVGLAGDNLTLRDHDKEELAHYAKEGAGVCDVEYRFPFTAPGYGELEGVAHRSNFDLTQHAEHCGKGDKLQYFDQEKNERYFPHVIEPSAGADRGTLALLCEAYTPTPDRSGSKAIMKFTPRMAPIKAAIFPLVNKDGMPEVAEKLYKELRTKHVVQMDVKQSIGKRYARMDEAGTPYCFTIDGDTLTDQTVTVRERDTASQERISIDKVRAYLAEKLGR